MSQNTKIVDTAKDAAVGATGGAAGALVAQGTVGAIVPVLMKWKGIVIVGKGTIHAPIIGNLAHFAAMPTVALWAAGAGAVLWVGYKAFTFRHGKSDTNSQ